jgi:hypothetical protein
MTANAVSLLGSVAMISPEDLVRILRIAAIPCAVSFVTDMLLAVRQVWAGSHEQALEKLERAVEVNPTAEALVLYATELQRDAKPDSASRMLAQLKFQEATTAPAMLAATRPFAFFALAFMYDNDAQRRGEGASDAKARGRRAVDAGWRTLEDLPTGTALFEPRFLRRVAATAFRLRSPELGRRVSSHPATIGGEEDGSWHRTWARSELEYGSAEQALLVLREQVVARPEHAELKELLAQAKARLRELVEESP